MTAFDGLRVAFAPMLPWPVLIALGAAALLLLGFGLLRRARGLGWRWAALTLLWLALANPALVAERREPRKDVALVVVDESASQRVGDRAAQAERALARLSREAAEQPDLELRVLRVGAEQGRLLSEEGTLLFGPAERALAEIPRRSLAGVILITDGQVHDAPADAARLPTAPLHALITGGDGEADRRLSIVRAPTFGLVEKPVTVTIRVEDPGASGLVELLIAEDGGPPRREMVPVNQDYDLEQMVRHGGANVVELAVAAGPRELTLENNQAILSIGGVRDRLQVLLISGEPHAGERTWRNLLKSDPSVDLIHFTILRPPEKQDGTPINELSLIAFPVRPLFEDKLKDFDLIIFDRYKRQNIIPRIYLEAIARYVAEGGAVLEASGPTFAGVLSLSRSPIGEVLPGRPTGEILEGAFKPTLSAVGQRHPVTAELEGAAAPGREPGWGAWYRHIEIAPERGDVVMNGAGGRPLLVLDRVGEGRVAQLASDHIWLWSRGYQGGGPQAELLRRVAHWLMKEPQLEERALRGEARAGRLEIQRRALTPGAATVEVTRPDGTTTTIALQDNPNGLQTGSVPIEAQGLYRLRSGDQTALAAAGRLNPVELSDLRSTDAVVRPLVQARGGGAVRIGDGEGPSLRRVRAAGWEPDRPAAGRDWIGLLANRDYAVTGVETTPLLPGWAALALLLSALLFAWRREGR